MESLPKKLAHSGAKAIEARLSSISGGAILDVATQRGEFIQTLLHMLKEYESFVGIDISEKDLTLAKKQFTNQSISFRVMNAETLDFASNSFDTVCISHSLHHLENIEAVLTEMKRVLKPKGWFFLQEMFCDGLQSEAQVSDILQHHWDAKIDTLLGEFHNQTLTKCRLEEIVRNLGLCEIEIFESTHPAKCLRCDDKFVCDDPMNAQIIKSTIAGIDRQLNRLNEYLVSKNLQNALIGKKLQKEGEKLKARVKRFGSAPASHLFLVGKK